MVNTPNSDRTGSKTFSIKEFTDIFVGIDEKIFQLHQCSSDDFLGLNADFKQYFKQTKVISQNADEIFRSLTESGSEVLLENLEDLYKDLKQIQNEFSKHIESSIKFLKEMIVLLDKLFLPVKNLNQDLLTLKFLLANLKVSNSTYQQHKILNTEQVLNSYNQVINEFKICSFQNETNISSLKDQVRTVLGIFEQIRERNIHDLDTILNNIHFGIILFAEKHEEVSRQIPDLSSKTESSSKSMAEIITNLQYHDIIRQKMEHIQATHKKILVDLEESCKDQESDFIDNQSKILVRIRDIANLQSAQLVHANKEYQKAIEVITDKFLTIGNDMTTISQMCHNINASQDNSDEFHLQALHDKLKNSASVFARFLEAGDNFINHIDVLTTQVNSTSRTIPKFSDALQKLKEATGQTINFFSASEINDPKIGESLKQVQNLFDEVEKFEGVIQQVYNKIERTGQNLLPDIGQKMKIAKKAGTFGQAAVSMNSIINQLNQKNTHIKKLLNENLSTSKQISNDIRESIGKVRYYDFFEKVIVDIITEFNHIYKKLKEEVSLGSENKAEDIDSLKSIYTMASEHVIHDKVIQNQGDVDMFDDEPQQHDEDDDNLELF